MTKRSAEIITKIGPEMACVDRPKTLMCAKPIEVINMILTQQTAMRLSIFSSYQVRNLLKNMSWKRSLLFIMVAHNRKKIPLLNPQDLTMEKSKIL